jgi:hypothetical protein
MKTLKTCQHCNVEFYGPDNRKFCSMGCRWDHNSLKTYQRRMRGSAEPRQMPEWKQQHIRIHHMIRTIEEMAAFIKKPVSEVKNFCETNGLKYRSNPHVPIDKYKPSGEKAFERPPAVYDNQTKTFPYYIALL